MKRSFRELYKRIAESEWFRKAYRGKSLGDFFPTTDEEIERFLTTHPKVEVPEKYKTPDFVFKRCELNTALTD